MGIGAAIAGGGIGAAIAGAGVAAAVGGVASSVIGAGAAKSAAKTEANAANNAAALQEQAGQQAVGLLQPYANEGQVGINALNGELSYLDTPYTPTEAQLEATPGYQFANDQGLQATQNSAAAQGLGVSGAALKAASAYSTGLAQQTYAQDASIYQQNQSQIGNLLTGIVANGQNAATSQAGALTGQANAAAGTSLTGAQATAAGDVGSANAVSSGISSLSNSFSQTAILSALLGQNTGSTGSTVGSKSIF